MTEHISADKQIRETTPPQTAHDPDEINLLEYIYAIVKNKWWIIGATVLGIAGGYIAAMVKGPTWVAEVVIAPKEAETQKAPNLSSFGAFSGLVASQLNIGGDASLDKIDRLLSSRDFSARMITRYNLLPAIFQYQWPKVYTQFWDSSANDWKKTFNKPELLSIGSYLKGTFLKKEIKEKIMTIAINSRDSALSLKLAQGYVSFLDEDIKSSVRSDAKGNVDFLENQIVTVADPLLREKIQTLIADEIEKTMVVSKEAFKVVDPVYLQRMFKEKKIYPIVFGTGMFFCTVILVIFIHVLVSVENTEENRGYIEKIQRGLLPKRKKLVQK